MSLDIYLHRTSESESEWVYTTNITHNLGKLATEADIYKHIWRPEELHITKAGDLIEPLVKGLNRLLTAPEHFKRFSSTNGWGTYDQFIPFLVDYILACINNPEAFVKVSR